MRVSTRRMSPIVLLLAAACSAPAPAIQGAPPGTLPTPGAAGIGDSYFPGLGNGGYDVAHYDLHLEVDPVANRLDAMARIDATATQALSSFYLDLEGLDVGAAWVDDVPARHVQQGAELLITPATPLAAGQAFRVRIDYGGNPHGIETDAIPIPGGIGWMHVEGEVYVMSEPMGAASFFPCNDHPLDKATYRYEIVAPAGLTVAANGLLLEQLTLDDGRVAHVWSAGDPMASYLATFAVGPFDLVESTTLDGLPLHHYFHRDTPPEARQAFDSTSAMLAYFAELFGEYPFESCGAILSSAPFPGALETQTIPIYGSGAAHESVVAHELAHQWFGDSVSITDWSEIWLCEGFAEYAAWLWSAHSDGEDALTTRLERTYRFLANPAMGRPADPGVRQLFGGGVYLRGAWTLRVLHEAVGDEVFFAIMRRWCGDHRDGNATIAQFVDLVAELGGEAQRAPLLAWLYDERPPVLERYEQQAPAEAR